MPYGMVKRFEPIEGRLLTAPSFGSQLFGYESACLFNQFDDPHQYGQRHHPAWPE
jgi:hypothetical protein